MILIDLLFLNAIFLYNNDFSYKKWQIKKKNQKHPLKKTGTKKLTY